MAGLVSYKFGSVNARKSLGLNRLNHEQRMVGELEAASQRQYCAIQRGDRILAKTSNRRFSKQQSTQEAIMNDTLTDTDTFLRGVVAESAENTLIYNEKARKLNYIKEYMAQEKADYEVAAHIVNHIEHGDEPKPTPKKAVPATDPNDEAHLVGRRMPSQRRPLMVTQFQFIE